MTSCKVLAAIAHVPRPAWDALAVPGGAPFLEWGFLDALERSGSAVAARGWTPRHLTLWRGDALIAAIPAYAKTHSMGEFMYNDFRWSGVTPRFGVSYYPKLILGAPFSPATGPRPLVAAGEDRRALTVLLARAAQELAREEGYSSVNVLFARPEDLPAFAEADFTPGAGLQFHWYNRGFGSFGDFLGQFNSKRRHMLKSERAQLAKDGTTVRTLRGEELTPEVLAFASRCYEATTDKHAWNAAHLTPEFFRMAGEQFPHLAEVVLAEEGGRWLGSAFNLRGATRLYGRHWGALEDRRYLHFNVCYYHSIERCIAEGREAFEPGAGGEHKLARGFEPTLVHSAHWFVNERLQAAMRNYLPQEVAAHQEQVEIARESAVAFKAGRSG